MSVAPDPAARPPELTELEIATRGLLIALREIHAALPGHPRLSALKALNTVHAFIGVAGAPEGLAESQINDLRAPLTSLAAALGDLEGGSAPPPILMPRAKSGRRPDGTGRAILKGAASAAMSVLMAHIGLGREEAAKLVVKKLSGKGFDLKKKDWQTVAAWRDQMHSKSKTNSSDSAVEAYRRCMKGASAAAKWEGFPAPDKIDPWKRKALCDVLLDSLSFPLAHGAD